MPLIKKSSKKALKHNIEAEMHAHPDKKHHAQNLAIAYDVQRRAKQKHMSEGGKVEHDMAEHMDVLPASMHESIVDAVMRKLDERRMAEGGMVDLDENAEEEPNHEDQLSFEALIKENYSEESALEEAHQPEDSNEHGDDLKDEDSHDMVDIVRKKIKHKRGM